jgi:hypothetical protein
VPVCPGEAEFIRTLDCVVQKAFRDYATNPSACGGPLVTDSIKDESSGGLLSSMVRLYVDRVRLALEFHGIAPSDGPVCIRGNQ